MQVRMMLQGLSPGMKHAKEADPGAQALWVGGDLEQGLGSRPKQQVIDDSFVLQRQCGELLRQGKDYMEILDKCCRQHLSSYVANSVMWRSLLSNKSLGLWSLPERHITIDLRVTARKPSNLDPAPTALRVSFPPLRRLRELWPSFPY